MLNRPQDTINNEGNNLNGNSLFYLLHSDDALRIKNEKATSFYKKNQPLFIEGSYPRGVFCIISGKVKVFSTGETGKEQIIRIAGAGDVVGFRALFSEEPYRLSATTLEESSIFFIKIEDFLELVHSQPELLQAVLRELSKESGERADFIKAMAQKTVRERLAIVLLVLESIYKDDLINLSREDLANFVGTATETLIRLLKDFKDENLIEVQGRKIKLIDVDRIYQESGY
ncbi:MAG TPA: Crp/Fnr family transcriptional regulator [Brumimicrobium sp.]|nr:Crp/Fnr family transcriptional regulator [Brumimicrobium sp.]